MEASINGTSRERSTYVDIFFAGVRFRITRSLQENPTLLVQCGEGVMVARSTDADKMLLSVVPFGEDE